MATIATNGGEVTVPTRTCGSCGGFILEPTQTLYRVSLEWQGDPGEWVPAAEALVCSPRCALKELARQLGLEVVAK